MSESQRAKFDIASKVADIGMKIVIGICAFFASFVFYGFSKTQQNMQEVQEKIQENVGDLKTKVEVLNVQVNGLGKTVDDIKTDVKDLSRKDGDK